MYRPRIVRLGTLAMFGVIACFGGCRRHNEHKASRLDDVYAAQKVRPVELRLTGVVYLPAPSPHRGPSSTPAAEDAAAYRALSSSKADGRTRALAFLLLNNLRAAVGILRGQADEKPSASAWSDLAVALYQQGRSESNTRITTAALAAVDHALRLDARLPDALFNRAAILQQLGWRDAAVHAWERYLAIDATSPWAEEGRARLKLARMPTDFQRWPNARAELAAAAAAGRSDEIVRLVQAFPQQVRTTAEVEDLANWASAYRQGHRSQAARILIQLQEIANALITVNGERLLFESVKAATARPDVLSRAHIQYREARLLIRDRKVTVALQAIAEAEELFQAGASPMALVAGYYRAGVLFDLDRPAQAQRLLERIRNISGDGFNALRAQILWEESFRATRRDEGYSSLTPNASSLAIFERLGERDNVIRLLANRAATLTLLGRDEEGWRLRTKLFLLAGQSGRPDSVESALHGSGFAAIQEEQFDVAHSLFTLLLDSAGQSPVRRYDAALFRTLAGARMGIASPTDVSDLERTVESLPDETLKENGRDELAYVKALFQQQRSPADAVIMLSRCIEHREKKHLWTLPETYAARGETYRLTNDYESATRDLEHALSLLEDQRSRISEERVRDSFFASANTICLSLADLQVSQGAYERAFVTTERCRARVLGDVPSDRSGSVLADSRRVRTALGPSTTLLHYTVLENRIIAFIVRRNGVTTRTIGVPRKTVEAAVAQTITTATDADPTRFEAATHELNSLLISPIVSVLPPTDALIIVPDEVLSSAPFAALRSAAGRYLIEDHELMIAPSASWYVKSVRNLPATHTASHVTIVADPAFDPAVGSNLKRLFAARKEAQDLGALYPDATILVDRNATPHRFLQALAGSDLVHVASHAVVSVRDASQSALVLASDEHGGLVSLAVIREQILTRRPLLMLAGCKSAVGGTGKGSVRSLALAFLAAGARGVVGSVWNVDDESTHTLSIAFHRRLREGRSPSNALRAAQLQMLNSSDSSQREIRAWGAFQYYGFNDVQERRYHE